MSQRPRISFGIIVLNGEPFTRYTLRALYPFAHEIIVVEGAAKGAASISTPDGHSRDGTLGTLYRFQAEEDPEHKVQIITRDGFWTEKDEMSQAYAERATGDYLWQVDIDEFWLPEDMATVIQWLQDDPSITQISAQFRIFWGSIHYECDGWANQRFQGRQLWGRLRTGQGYHHRVFKWQNGYHYVTHRPPTVHDSHNRDLRHQHWLDSHYLAQRDIFIYHYSLLFPKQVWEKSDYYQNAAWSQRKKNLEWVEQVYLRLASPFRVYNIYYGLGWLTRYRGPHHPQILQLWEDIQQGRITIETRHTQDVEDLLNSWWYTPMRFVVKHLDYPDRLRLFLQNRLVFPLGRVLLPRQFQHMVKKLIGREM